MSGIPVRLAGYGERWEGDECFLRCEGVVRQAAVFAEALELTRTIEVQVGTNVIRLHDVVTNRGFRRTPHMYCYHVNAGHPVVDEGTRYLAPIADVVWAAHAGDAYERQGIGYDVLSDPRDEFREQVWQHEMLADADGRVPVALVNDRLGVGLSVVTRKDQFPCMYEWQNLQAGQYAVGLEPSTHHVLGAAAARRRGEAIWLERGERREYHSTITILSGPEDLARAEAAIRAIGGQPEQPFPTPSNAHRRLRPPPDQAAPSASEAGL